MFGLSSIGLLRCDVFCHLVTTFYLYGMIQAGKTDSIYYKFESIKLFLLKKKSIARTKSNDVESLFA